MMGIVMLLIKIVLKCLKSKRRRLQSYIKSLTIRKDKEGKICHIVWFNVLDYYSGYISKVYLNMQW